MRLVRTVVQFAVCSLALPGGVLATVPLGTEFTYQGRLLKDGVALTDSADFQFELYDVDAFGSPVGSTIQLDDQSVTDGLFTVQLDFGLDVFDVDKRWLEVRVRSPHDPNDTLPFTTLSPRQPLTATPFALQTIGVRTRSAGDVLYPDSPNIVAGYKSNSAATTISGATIAGGGHSGSVNTVGADFATVGGGTGNDAGGALSTIGGGSENRAAGPEATVGGGGDNQAIGSGSHVGGGYGNIAEGILSTISGGSQNSTAAATEYVTIGGGVGNTAAGHTSVIGGGEANSTSGEDSTIGGGDRNIASGEDSTISGGQENVASGFRSTISGGEYSSAAGSQASVGGGSYNEATAQYARVGGGSNNHATGVESTIGGGANNVASGELSTIGGGINNNAYSEQSTVGGGVANEVDASALAGTIGGGRTNSVSGNEATIGGGSGNIASADGSTIAGGYTNEASGFIATIGGGYLNVNSGEMCTLAGGYSNLVSGTRSVVGGGSVNSATAWASTVGGGGENAATSQYATVGGGHANSATADNSTVGGGDTNAASGLSSTVSGGYLNVASAAYSTACGGRLNQAGGEYSFAAGRRAKVRDPSASGDADGDEGTVVWADSTDADFTSSGPDQFLIRAGGGVGIGTNDPNAALHIKTATTSRPALLLEFSARDIAVPTTQNLQIGHWDGATFTERMRIDDAGLVGIGRVPAANNLEVEGTACKTTAGGWVVCSDARIKTDVQTIDGALDVLDRVRLVDFRYTDEYRAQHPTIENRPYVNVIAQEFAEVFPDYVQDSGERLPDGQPILQVDSYPLTIYSAAAVQELHALVKQKDTQIAAQQTEIDDLRARLARVEHVLNELAPAQAGGSR